MSNQLKTLPDLKADLKESIAEFDREKERLFDPEPERLYHSKCGALVKKRWWWQKAGDPDVPICVTCDERVAEAELLTYREWKGRNWDPARS